MFQTPIRRVVLEYILNMLMCLRTYLEIDVKCDGKLAREMTLELHLSIVLYVLYKIKNGNRKTQSLGTD